MTAAAPPQAQSRRFALVLYLWGDPITGVPLSLTRSFLSICMPCRVRGGPLVIGGALYTVHTRYLQQDRLLGSDCSRAQPQLDRLFASVASPLQKARIVRRVHAGGRRAAPGLLTCPAPHPAPSAQPQSHRSGHVRQRRGEPEAQGKRPGSPLLVRQRQGGTPSAAPLATGSPCPQIREGSEITLRGSVMPNEELLCPHLSTG